MWGHPGGLRVVRIARKRLLHWCMVISDVILQYLLQYCNLGTGRFASSSQNGHTSDPKSHFGHLRYQFGSSSCYSSACISILLLWQRRGVIIEVWYEWHIFTYCSLVVHALDRVPAPSLIWAETTKIHITTHSDMLRNVKNDCSDIFHEFGTG